MSWFKVVAMSATTVGFGKRIEKHLIYQVPEKDRTEKSWSVWSLDGDLLGTVRKEWLCDLDEWREFQIGKLL